MSWPRMSRFAALSRAASSGAAARAAPSRLGRAQAATMWSVARAMWPASAVVIASLCAARLRMWSARRRPAPPARISPCIASSSGSTVAMEARETARISESVSGTRLRRYGCDRSLRLTAPAGTSTTPRSVSTL
ncbi:hypothetical protein ACU4GA_09360 [Methylobacterium oryzae CBMB20]